MHYLANFAKEGVRCAHVNALLAALPDLDQSEANHLSTIVVNLGEGYVLLHKCDKVPVLSSDGMGRAIWEFLGRNGILKIRRWACVQLLNGQIARSAWREKRKTSE